MVRKILLVDDEALIRMIAALALRRTSAWQVIEASSGAEALDKIAAERPDVVLLDCVMGGMDGPETLSRIRALPGGEVLPVVFMTAMGERDELLALGACGVITKPFDPVTLSQQVTAILERAR